MAAALWQLLVQTLTATIKKERARKWDMKQRRALAAAQARQPRIINEYIIVIIHILQVDLNFTTCYQFCT